MFAQSSYLIPSQVSFANDVIIGKVSVSQLLPKLCQEEVGYKGTNHKTGKVCSFCRREEVQREFVSTGEVAILSCLVILDIRKKANGSDIDLDQAELSFLVG
jgi:hypothetical protein